MITVPAQIFCEPRAEFTAAARSMPGVCGVLLSSRSLLMTLTPSVRQSRNRELGMVSSSNLGTPTHLRHRPCLVSSGMHHEANSRYSAGNVLHQASGAGSEQ